MDLFFGFYGQYLKIYSTDYFYDNYSCNQLFNYTLDEESVGNRKREENKVQTGRKKENNGKKEDKLKEMDGSEKIKEVNLENNKEYKGKMKVWGIISKKKKRRCEETKKRYKEVKEIGVIG